MTEPGGAYLYAWGLSAPMDGVCSRGLCELCCVVVSPQNHNKDVSLETWKKQEAQERKLKAREAKARAEYITVQVRQARVPWGVPGGWRWGRGLNLPAWYKRRERML